jgi:hypothetical protein
LPLLLSDQVGLADFLTGADCLVYPARDLDALTTVLKKLHDRRGDPAWTNRSARHVRQRDQFSAERVAKQILALVSNNAK